MDAPSDGSGSGGRLRFHEARPPSGIPAPAMAPPSSASHQAPVESASAATSARATSRGRPPPAFHLAQATVRTGTEANRYRKPPTRPSEKLASAGASGASTVPSASTAAAVRPAQSQRITFGLRYDRLAPAVSASATRGTPK